MAFQDAIVYPIAVIGALHLTQALIGGVSGPGMDARLVRIDNRLTAAPAVAAFAAGALGG
jgi:hypothetical protein